MEFGKDLQNLPLLGIGSSLLSLSDAFPRVLSMPLPVVLGFALVFVLTVGPVLQNFRNHF